MGDVDALVPAEDMQTARSALLRAGYEPEKGKPHEDAMHWGVQKDGVIFEVHRSVTNSAALPEGFLPLDGRQTVQTVYGSFTALNATTHACAMLRHFVSSGFGLQQLYDWAFWLKNMPVDAQKVHALACAAGAERFLYAVTRVCANSFGLQTDYGWEAQMDGSVSERILEDILLGGNWGMKEGDRTYSLVFTATEGRAAQGRGAQIAGKLDRLAEELCPWTRRHRGRSAYSLHGGCWPANAACRILCKRRPLRRAGAVCLPSLA